MALLLECFDQEVIDEDDGLILPVIPVLVTGIQQRHAHGAENSFHGADTPWLDPCDKHRDDGGRGCRTS